MYYWYIKRLLVRVCLTYQWSLDWCVFVILEASYNAKKRFGEYKAKWESTAEMKDMPNYLKSALESRNIAEDVTTDSQYQFKTLCIISCMTFFPIFVLICCRVHECDIQIPIECTYMYMYSIKNVYVYWIYIENPFILITEERSTLIVLLQLISQVNKLIC